LCWGAQAACSPNSAMLAAIAEVLCKHICSLVFFASLDFVSSAVFIYTLLTQVSDASSIFSDDADFFCYHGMQLACMMHVCLKQIKGGALYVACLQQ